MKYINYKKSGRSQGYSLLLAILIINIVLAMSLGIFSITIKALMLAAFMKDSQKAFGVADRALECALYWDRAYNWNGITPAISIFSTGSSYTPPTNMNNVTCGGQRLNNASAPPAGTGWSVVNTAATGTTNFTLTYPTEGTCAQLRVIKDQISTKITVNGYNTCATNNPRRVQRTIQANTE